MPFIDLYEPSHHCRTPGRSVDYETTWYCPVDFWVWEYVECDPVAIRCIKAHQLDGHWERKDYKYEEASDENREGHTQAE